MKSLARDGRLRADVQVFPDPLQHSVRCELFIYTLLSCKSINIHSSIVELPSSDESAI